MNNTLTFDSSRRLMPASDFFVLCKFKLLNSYYIFPSSTNVQNPIAVLKMKCLNHVQSRKVTSFMFFFILTEAFIFSSLSIGNKGGFSLSYIAFFEVNHFHLRISSKCLDFWRQISFFLEMKIEIIPLREQRKPKP